MLKYKCSIRLRFDRQHGGWDRDVLKCIEKSSKEFGNGKFEYPSFSYPDISATMESIFDSGGSHEINLYVRYDEDDVMIDFLYMMDMMFEDRESWSLLYSGFVGAVDSLCVEDLMLGFGVTEEYLIERVEALVC